MGLNLSVGILADLKENDNEGYEDFLETFKNVNNLLNQNGIPPHKEPDNIVDWDAEMYGYSGLHYLRRLAAYIDSGSELPSPGNSDSSEDDRLNKYFDDVVGGSGGFIKSMFKKKIKFGRNFDHLIVHSDAEGFYLPINFNEVLFSDDDVAIPGGMIGSTPKLLQECKQLGRVLKIPEHITKDSDELWDAADSQGEGSEIWQKYGVESFTCVALLEACEQSMKTGAAIVFC